MHLKMSSGKFISGLSVLTVLNMTRQNWAMIRSWCEIPNNTIIGRCSSVWQKGENNAV